MKRIVFFILPVLLFVGKVFATPELYNTDPLTEIESRVISYLQSILSPDEYMVFVTARPGEFSSESTKPELNDRETTLPGVPGLMFSEKTKKVSYVDIQGNTVGKSESRPPVVVNLVLGTTVPPVTQQLIKRVLPMIAKIDKTKGDSVRVTTGQLKWNEKKNDDSKDKSWIENLMKFKQEILIFFLMISAVVLAYAFIKGFATSFQRKESSPQMIPQPVQGPALPQSSNKEDSSTDSTKPNRALTAQELYSRDEAFMGLTQDIADFAGRYPERISFLLTEWIQQGVIGARNAAVLLHNFNLRTSETILEKLVPTDLDYVKAHFDSKFDKFSEENVKVIYLARIDLMKITSIFSRRTNLTQAMDFLASVEDDVLTEILRVMDAEVVAFACAYVPTHRVTSIIKSMSPETESQFIRALCDLEKLSPEKSKSFTELLVARHREVQMFSFTSTTKAQTLSKIVRNVGSVSDQRRILSVIGDWSEELNSKVREQVVIFDDLLNLPDRIVQSIVAGESPEDVAFAVVKLPLPFQEKIQSFLSSSAQEMFISTISAQHNIRAQDIERAQAQLVFKIEKMIEDKALDMKAFKKKSEPPAELKVVA